MSPSSFQVGTSTYVFDWSEIHSASRNMAAASLTTLSLQALYQTTYLKLSLLYSIMSAGVNKAYQAKQWLLPTVLPNRMRVYIDDPTLANAVYLKVWNHAGTPVLHIRLLSDLEGIADDASSSPFREWYDLIRCMQNLPLRQVEIAIVPSDDNNWDEARALSVREGGSATTPLTIPLAKSGVTFALEDFSRFLSDSNPGGERGYSLLDPKILTRVIERYSSLFPDFFDNEIKGPLELGPDLAATTKPLGRHSFVLETGSADGAIPGQKIIYSGAGEASHSGFIILTSPSRPDNELQALGESEILSMAATFQTVFDGDFIHRAITATQSLHSPGSMKTVKSMPDLPAPPAKAFSPPKALLSSALKAPSGDRVGSGIVRSPGGTASNPGRYPFTPSDLMVTSDFRSIPGALTTIIGRLLGLNQMVHFMYKGEGASGGGNSHNNDANSSNDNSGGNDGSGSGYRDLSAENNNGEDSTLTKNDETKPKITQKANQKSEEENVDSHNSYEHMRKQNEVLRKLCEDLHKKYLLSRRENKCLSEAYNQLSEGKKQLTIKLKEGKIKLNEKKMKLIKGKMKLNEENEKLSEENKKLKEELESTRHRLGELEAMQQAERSKAKKEAKLATHITHRNTAETPLQSSTVAENDGNADAPVANEQSSSSAATTHSGSQNSQPDSDQLSLSVPVQEDVENHNTDHFLSDSRRVIPDAQGEVISEYRLLMHTFSWCLLTEEVKIFLAWVRQNWPAIITESEVRQAVNDVDRSLTLKAFIRLDAEGIISSVNLNTIREYFESERGLRTDFVHAIDSFLAGNYQPIRSLRAAAKTKTGARPNHGFTYRDTDQTRLTSWISDPSSTRSNSHFDTRATGLAGGKGSGSTFGSASAGSARVQADSTLLPREQASTSSTPATSGWHTSEPMQNEFDDTNNNWVCVHFKRHCYVKFDCCSDAWPCHHCHNSSSNCENRTLRSRDIKEVVCAACYEHQPFTQFCRKCARRFADYACSICMHLTGTDVHPFHCEKCGICRVHGDRAFHCDVCGTCMDVQLRDNHRCLEDSAHDTPQNQPAVSSGHQASEHCTSGRSISDEDTNNNWLCTQAGAQTLSCQNK